MGNYDKSERDNPYDRLSKRYANDASMKPVDAKIHDAQEIHEKREGICFIPENRKKVPNRCFCRPQSI